MNLAELAGTTGLLLVPVVALGAAGDGLAVGDSRRPGLGLDLEALLQLLQRHAQVQLPEAPEYQLILFDVALQAEARVFFHQSPQ